MGTLLTIGGPRVGNKNFVELLEQLLAPIKHKIYRFVTDNDPVVDLLPLFTGYRHHGSPTLFQPSGTGSSAMLFGTSMSNFTQLAKAIGLTKKTSESQVPTPF